MAEVLRVATVAALRAIGGLVHGFEQSPGPRSRESRDDGRRRVQTALADVGRVLFLKQVHGVTVVEAPWDGTPEADAALAERPGLLLGIETADCLPILLVDPERRAVAAAHAGWRGTAASVARRAVEALTRRGTAAKDLVAGLGPAIGRCCYEVGDELRSAFGDAADRVLSPGPRGRPHLDLRAANVDQLQSAGIPAQRIHHVADCTRCRADLYPSYRREGPGAGRMISYVGFTD